MRCTRLAPAQQRWPLTADVVRSAGDVPVIAPMQTYRGALRASLQQRAPSAVRDFAVPTLAPPQEPRSSRLSWEDAAEMLSGDTVRGSDATTEPETEADTPPQDTGAASSRSPAAVKQEDVAAASDALAVLAETVATGEAPSTPNGKAAAPAETEPLAALEAINALAALGTVANSAEVVGPEVEFTARELQLLSAELERGAGPEILAREQLRQEGVQETADAAELLQMGGELPACQECGAIPYLSFLRCSCRWRIQP